MLSVIKKTLVMIALCLGLNSINLLDANAGLESLTNNSSAIKSHTSGKVNVPYEMGKDYVERVVLVGKLGKALVNSQYSVKDEGKNKFLFYSEGGNSEFEIIEDACTSNTFRKGAGIVGSRSSFGPFVAYLVVNFQSNSVGNIDYDSKMYTVLSNTFINVVVRNLVPIPFLGSPIRRFFEKEQDGTIMMINSIAEKAFEDPARVLEIMKNYTNEFSFTKEDINYVRESLIKNGFLK